MALDSINIMEGFIAHLIGGVIGGVTGWFLHTIYRWWERRKQHAEFDREIIDFVIHLKSLVSKDHMPSVMERVVPLVSKATFGTEVPPLKESYLVPSGTTFNCKMCERSITPTGEARCPTCKLGVSSYHENPSTSNLQNSTK